MRVFILSLFIFFGANGFAQSSSESYNYFAQGMFNLQDSKAKELEYDLRHMEMLQTVRLDVTSQRFFILTTEQESLDVETVRSWFGDNGVNLTCIQVGRHGVDIVNKFPFTNCED